MRGITDTVPIQLTKTPPHARRLGQSLWAGIEARVLRAWILFPAALLLCLFVMLRSTMSNPFSGGVPLTDSGIFTVTGRGILAGKVPYRDMFGSKGLFLYFLNAFAQWVSPGTTWGLYLLEVLTVACSVCLAYRCVRVFAGRPAAVVGGMVTLYITLLSGNYEGGNFSEVYTLPMALLGLLLFLRDYERPAEKRYGLPMAIASGALAALTFFTRPNAVVFWAFPCLFAGLELLFRGKIVRALLFGFGFALGCLLASAPFALYMYQTDSIDDMLSSVLGHGTTYVSRTAFDFETLRKTWLKFFETRSYSLVAVCYAAVSQIIPWRFRIRNVWARLAMLGMCAAVSYTTVMSGRVYGHYFLLTVPIVVLGLVMLARTVQDRVLWRHAAMAVAVFMLLLSRQGGFAVSEVAYGLDAKPKPSAVRDAMSAAEPGAELLVLYSTDSSYYLITDRATDCRFFAVPATAYEQYPIAGDTQILYLRDRRPPYVLIYQKPNGTLQYHLYDLKNDGNIGRPNQSDDLLALTTQQLLDENYRRVASEEVRYRNGVLAVLYQRNDLPQLTLPDATTDSALVGS